MATQEQVQVPPIGPVARPRRMRVTLQSVVPYVLLVALIGGLIALQPNLFRISWVERKTDSTLTLVLVVVGQTIVILTGGIDLSVGGVISLSNAIAATQFGDGGPQMFFWMAV